MQTTLNDKYEAAMILLTGILNDEKLGKKVETLLINNKEYALESYNDCPNTLDKAALEIFNSLCI